MFMFLSTGILQPEAIYIIRQGSENDRAVVVSLLIVLVKACMWALEERKHGNFIMYSG